jgi:hypothetical protein
MSWVCSRKACHQRGARRVSADKISGQRLADWDGVTRARIAGENAGQTVRQFNHFDRLPSLLGFPRGRDKSPKLEGL